MSVLFYFPTVGSRHGHVGRLQVALYWSIQELVIDVIYSSGNLFTNPTQTASWLLLYMECNGIIPGNKVDSLKVTFQLLIELLDVLCDTLPWDQSQHLGEFSLKLMIMILSDEVDDFMCLSMTITR